MLQIKIMMPLGPLASGVPGFVAGTWELKQRLGGSTLTWSDLLQPAIDMCYKGIVVNHFAARYTCSVSLL